MRSLLPIYAVAGVTACTCAAQLEPAPAANSLPESVSKAQWTVRGQVTPEKFIMQSHRGAGEGFVGRHVSKMSEVFELMRGKPERRRSLGIKNADLEPLAAEARLAAGAGPPVYAE